MKLFLFNLSKFCVSLISFVILLVVASIAIERHTFDFGLPTTKTVLIIGDSHTECAIDDSFLPYAYNFSKSGSSFFYSFVKLKAILEKNKHIQAVVLSFASQDLSKLRDTWFSGPETIKFYMPRFLFLCSWGDFKKLFLSNPIEVTVNLPRVFFWGLFDAFRFKFLDNSLMVLGAFNNLERSKLQEAKERLGLSNENFWSGNSSYQEEYLLKIYQLVVEENIDLYLLNTPMHSYLNNFPQANSLSNYLFAKIKMPKARLVDHSNIAIDDKGFGDLEHLNHIGAKVYSDYLRRGGFFLKSVE